MYVPISIKLCFSHYFRVTNYEIVSDTPEMQHVEGLQFAYVRLGGMYFVVLTRVNLSPAEAIEFVSRVAQLIRDYCGVLTEEAIRKNLSLIYELLDEVAVRLTIVLILL